MSYYRESLEVQAIQFTGENLNKVNTLVRNYAEVHPNHVKDNPQKISFITISQNTQTRIAYPGDWVVLDSDKVIRVYEEKEFNKLFSYKE